MTAAGADPARICARSRKARTRGHSRARKIVARLSKRPKDKSFRDRLRAVGLPHIGTSAKSRERPWFGMPSVFSLMTR